MQILNITILDYLYKKTISNHINNMIFINNQYLAISSYGLQYLGIIIRLVYEIMNKTSLVIISLEFYSLII